MFSSTQSVPGVSMSASCDSPTTAAVIRFETLYQEKKDRNHPELIRMCSHLNSLAGDLISKRPNYSRLPRWQTSGCLNRALPRISRTVAFTRNYAKDVSPTTSQRLFHHERAVSILQLFIIIHHIPYITYVRIYIFTYVRVYVFMYVFTFLRTYVRILRTYGFTSIGGFICEWKSYLFALLRSTVVLNMISNAGGTVTVETVGICLIPMLLIVIAMPPFFRYIQKSSTTFVWFDFSCTWCIQRHWRCFI